MNQEVYENHRIQIAKRMAERQDVRGTAIEDSKPVDPNDESEGHIVSIRPFPSPKPKGPESCKTCRFSQLDVQRYCRRLPPLVTFDDVGNRKHSVFPMVVSSDWCGEFEVRA